MSFINYLSREINCKIVYYGPGLCGKTTNLQYIYNRTNPDAKGKMISLATETERTLFFDFLPLEIGEIRGFKTRFHLYTVPGQVFYDASRKLILKGVDGVVFVADSQMLRAEANIESMDNLRTNLGEQGYNLDTLPYVIQYNKRDMPAVSPVDELRSMLNPGMRFRISPPSRRPAKVSSRRSRRLPSSSSPSSSAAPPARGQAPPARGHAAPREPPLFPRACATHRASSPRARVAEKMRGGVSKGLRLCGFWRGSVSLDDQVEDLVGDPDGLPEGFVPELVAANASRAAVRA